jgi:hypothetical protein
MRSQRRAGVPPVEATGVGMRGMREMRGKEVSLLEKRLSVIASV